MINKIFHEIGLNWFYGFREIGRKIKKWLIEIGWIAPICSCGLECEKLEVGYNGDFKFYCKVCRKDYKNPFPY